MNRREWLTRVAGAAALGTACRQAFGVDSTPATSEAQAGLREVMERGGKCCLAWLDATKNFLPAGGYQVSHDAGRWWDAVLRLEAATGFSIPAKLEAAMVENFRFLTDNPAGLLANDERLAPLKGTAQANPHNFRESMLAFSALVRYRNHEWSRVQGRRLVESTLSLLEPDGQMNYERLAALMKVPLNDDPSMIQRSSPGQWFDATGSTGRSLEGFLRFYEADPFGPALELAERLAKVHLRNVTQPDGQVPPRILAATNVGHNHSYLGTLRGLLLYGLMTNQRDYVDAVATTYRRGLYGTVATESGWTPHDLGKSRFSNEQGDPVGEHGSCSDLIQLALWLGLRAGQIDLLDDVERLIRARLFPAQILNPKEPRCDGAWGVYGHPYSRGCILDVFAAVIHVLADVYASIATREADGTVSLNLHFSAATPLAVVEATRAERGRTRVGLRKPAALRLRVPSWSPREKLRLAVDGRSLPLRWDGPFLLVPMDAMTTGAAAVLEYDLPVRTSVETMPVSRRQFHLSWRGDEVVGCDPEVPIYPFRRVKPSTG